MENKCSPHHDPYKALQRLTGRIELEENCQFPRGLLRFVSQILICLMDLTQDPNC